eukprot:1158185-Pelagomonas_calceolata.AAC.4
MCRGGEVQSGGARTSHIRRAISRRSYTLAMLDCHSWLTNTACIQGFMCTLFAGQEQFISMLDCHNGLTQPASQT